MEIRGYRRGGMRALCSLSFQGRRSGALRTSDHEVVGFQVIQNSPRSVTGQIQDLADFRKPYLPLVAIFASDTGTNRLGWPRGSD
ncbi:hypothetical protein DdX_18688 [Ditylenchus destructor]|uniref:Uncharacterized protein n=1 Tax=Ditylenchus destructor TaxID=166010 RepID=A0AAD4MKQ3_9BILA|nr:hypothetical protein DdX_18688 [Ditylenchus destructor]